MKKYIINIFTILAALIVVYSCQKEDWTYNGPQYYEFSASSHNQSFANGIFHKENAKIGLDSMCVQLIKTSNSEVTVNYKLVKEVYYLKLENRYTDAVPTGTKDEDVDILTTDAVYGTDYEIVSGEKNIFDATSMEGTIKIAAGEYFAYIPVNMKVKSGSQFFVILKDSKDTKANRNTAILNYVIAPDKIFFLEESFATELPSTWQLIDKDGDGFCWEFYKQSVTSDSYRSSVGTLHPENYLISPKFDIGKKSSHVYLSFDVAPGKAKYPDENYRVIISETPITEANCQSATLLRDWTQLDASYADFKTETIDITAYKGKSVYIGFVHGNCSDNYFIRLKNIQVYGI